tara:strand:- start:4675 stop:4902 length:228 start_codon:yes stop_codon:yes gene_type:complete
MNTEEKFERIYNVLLHETELLAEEGITPPEMGWVLAKFLVKMTFDTAPSSDHAMWLIMGAINERLEENIGVAPTP